MQRIPSLSPEQASGKASELLAAAKAKIGMVPNLLTVLAQAPSTLQSYLSQVEANGQNSLTPQLREQIALATAGANNCDYCASAHTAMAKGAGVSADEATHNLSANSTDAKTQAALSFVAQLIEQRGHVSDADLASVRKAGFTDAQILEITATTCTNLFTNYMNSVCKTEIDSAFPKVSASNVKKAA